MLAIAPGALTALVQEMSAIGELQYHQRVRDLREMESQETLSFLDASDHMGCEPGRTFQLSAVTRQQCVLCIYAVPDRRVAYFYGFTAVQCAVSRLSRSTSTSTAARGATRFRRLEASN